MSLMRVQPGRLASTPAPLLRTLALAALLAGLAACGGPGPSIAPAPSSANGATTTPGPIEPTPVLTQAPPPTVVPGGPSDVPPSEPSATSTTTTDWGTILDAVPEGFPVYPGANPVEASGGPASGAWLSAAVVDDVATWYRDALEELGFTTDDLSSMLEDGSRVLDTVSDLPECRIRTTFRPAGESTMIIVLYGAGCAGGEG